MMPLDEATASQNITALIVAPGARIPQALGEMYSAAFKPENADIKFKITYTGPANINNKSRYHQLVFLMIPKGVMGNDIENTIEIFKYYADAPLTYLICDKSFEKNQTFIPSELLAKVVGEKPIFVPSLTTRKADPIVFETINQAIMTLELFEQSDVRPTFDKFDADGSGAIDASEFSEMMSSLGYELDEEQLEASLKSVDVNGDGSVDYLEFRRWYLCGMQSHSLAGKSLLKLQAGVGSLSNYLREREDGAAGKSKLKKQQVTINIGKKIDTIQSRISLRVNLFNSREYQTWLKEANKFNAENGVEMQQDDQKRVFMKLKVPMQRNHVEKLKTMLASPMMAEPLEQMKQMGSPVQFHIQNDTLLLSASLKTDLGELQMLQRLMLPDEEFNALGNFKCYSQIDVEFASKVAKVVTRNVVDPDIFGRIFEAIDDGVRIKSTLAYSKELVTGVLSQQIPHGAYLPLLACANLQLNLNYADLKELKKHPKINMIADQLEVLRKENIQGKKIFKVGCYERLGIRDEDLKLVFPDPEELERWQKPVKESAAMMDAFASIGSDLGEFFCEANVIIGNLGHATLTSEMPGFTNLWVKIWDHLFMQQNSYNIGRMTRGIHSHYTKKDQECPLAPWVLDRISAIDKKYQEGQKQ